jgi:hypothetical protein
MLEASVKVLFIAGNGRSGSTLLDVILGQRDGFFAVGELRRIWDRGLVENRPCGCGVPFRSCPTWQAIFAEAYGGFDQVDAARMVAWRERHTQTKHLPGMLLRRQAKARLPADVARTLEALYGAIARVTGCQVIVDASKWPMYAYMLEGLAGLDLHVLHLVRDPRAVAFSWSRHKEFEPERLLERQSALRSTAYWLAWNPAIAWLWNRRRRHYLFLPYERLVAHPQRELARAIQFAAPGTPPLPPWRDASTVELRATHAVAGNSVRLTQGPVELRLDDEWRHAMPAATQRLVSLLTWPWLLRYGYGIFDFRSPIAD